MSPELSLVHEGGIGSKRLRDLNLTIHGTPLEVVLKEFQRELAACGITKVRPHFYLSTEWGVPFDTISIAIPFYLTRIDLTDFHAERGGLVEGGGPSDVLRYIRHEMGHVVNYAYRLYERPDWIGQFGDINTPYEEEYRPKPFSMQYVVHLPGWYAQKHPDEDWAETFAVWMTPGGNWRERYAGLPALAKLNYCDRVMADLRDREPLTSAEDPDEDVGALDVTLDEYYQANALDEVDAPANLDYFLQAIFDDPKERKTTLSEPLAAAKLIRRVERTLSADVYRWTGWFPERARRLLHEIAVQADRLCLTYSEDQESSATRRLDDVHHRLGDKPPERRRPAWPLALGLRVHLWMMSFDGQLRDAIDKRWIVNSRGRGRHGEFTRLLQITTRVDFNYVDFARVCQTHVNSAVIADAQRTIGVHCHLLKAGAHLVRNIGKNCFGSLIFSTRFVPFRLGIEDVGRALRHSRKVHLDRRKRLRFLIAQDANIKLAAFNVFLDKSGVVDDPVNVGDALKHFLCGMDKRFTADADGGVHAQRLYEKRHVQMAARFQLRVLREDGEFRIFNTVK